MLEGLDPLACELPVPHKTFLENLCFFVVKFSEQIVGLVVNVLGLVTNLGLQ